MKRNKVVSISCRHEATLETMASNQDKDILRLIEQISSEKEYFTASELDGNTTGHQQRLSLLGENARKLVSAIQPPHAAFWELIRRV